MAGQGVPTDWTNGTGVFPAGGVITVPAAPYRNAVLVQNQDTTAVTLTLAAVKGSDGTDCTLNIDVPVAPTSGGAGGIEQLSALGFVSVGGFSVHGTAGSHVTVLTN